MKFLIAILFVILIASTQAARVNQGGPMDMMNGMMQQMQGAFQQVMNTFMTLIQCWAGCMNDVMTVATCAMNCNMDSFNTAMQTFTGMMGQMTGGAGAAAA